MCAAHALPRLVGQVWPLEGDRLPREATEAGLNPSRVCHPSKKALLIGTFYWRVSEGTRTPDRLDHK